jgi:hypothetical protein
VLGIASRRGEGYELTVVLGGLVVLGKKWEPQAGAELLADMLEDGMRRLATARPAAPTEKAVEDLPAAAPATNGDAAWGIAEASPELAIAPGSNGHH